MSGRVLVGWPVFLAASERMALKPGLLLFWLRAPARATLTGARMRAVSGIIT